MTMHTTAYGNKGFVHSSYSLYSESHRAQSHGGEIIGEYKTLPAARRALTIAHKRWLRERNAEHMNALQEVWDKPTKGETMNAGQILAKPYIYAPIPYYGGKVMKCQGIYTEKSFPIVQSRFPGEQLFVSAHYLGDRIKADTKEVFEG